MTAILTIVYPAADEDRFDARYYSDRHLPLVREAWGAFGLTRAEVVFGVAGLDTPAAPYAAIASLHFDAPAQIQVALGSEAATQVLRDVANFTTIKPVAQISSAS